MPAQTPAWFEPKFKRGAIHRLQSEGYLLRNTTQEGSTVDGSTVTWKRVGSGEASELQGGRSKSPVLNAGRDTVTATFKDYEANEFIKKADLNKMSENEQQIAQKTIGMACGRKFDSIILSTMDADTVNVTTWGDGSQPISITDIMEAQDIISDPQCGSYEYFCALPRRFMSQLELYTEFSSSDFVTDLPLLKQAGARRWRGITFIPMPKKFFNVPAANQADAYVWVRDAIGFEWNQQMSLRADYIPDEKGWFVASDMGCASALVLPEGVCRLRFKTSVALSRPAR